jgi:hypothetical protein
MGDPGGGSLAHDGKASWGIREEVRHRALKIVVSHKKVCKCPFYLCK